MLRFVDSAISDHRLNATIEFVFSNRESGEAPGSDEFFELVRSLAHPLVTLSSTRFRREHGGGGMSRHRSDFDREVMRLLEPYTPDVCVLAGYMLIFSPEMCRRFPLLNLHGALPDGPTGTWQSVIWSLIESKASQTGAMIHLATEDVDRGPVLSNCSFPIVGASFDDAWETVTGRAAAAIQTEEGEANPLFCRIRAEGLRREPQLILETLRAVADGRLQVKPGTALDELGAPLSDRYPDGLPLTEEIEKAIGPAI